MDPVLLALIRLLDRHLKGASAALGEILKYAEQRDKT